ncbi:MAG: GTPase ObgE [Deltaproteobacteria bacterium]|nr:GTPase ObgE [Deltaproteobacteria bacterium]
MSSSRSRISRKQTAFIDYARLKVSSGAGGAGCVSFRREKYVPRGGPDGGDGGWGGNVVVRADRNIHTLIDHRYRKNYAAENGRPGSGKRRTGRNGKDRVISVPCGTLIRNQETDEVLADLTQDGASVIVARGGRGGKGNAHFASSTHQTPRLSQPGEEGETLQIILELKLLADVGLVGFPNAGKSTFLSRISSARPRIADYPFTTLTPHLGTVEIDSSDVLVVADIPGLIRGAHDGCGLGDIFLRHVERCRVLLYLIDVSPAGPSDPVAAVLTLQEELQQYNPSMLQKKSLIAATKIDALQEDMRVAALKSFCVEQGFPLRMISSVTGEGIEALLRELSSMVTRLRREEAAEGENGNG